MEEQQRLQNLPELLLPWFAENARALPWRRDREPYHVWLSEIMLQQTRVEAVKGYYLRFLSALPDVRSLAEASEDRLHKLWEGLGYYSRVRNLHSAAIRIMSDYGGVFPQTYAEIRGLKGIGDYTAGAIASICFDLPTPAVDGNVLRVLARLNADPRPVDREETKRTVREALTEIYPIGRCGDFTQALMELGATVCTPNGAPNCKVCPLSGICASRGEENWKRYPVRTPKKPRREEKLTVFLLRCDGCIAVRKREDRGLLAGLWELPNVTGDLTETEAVEQLTAWDVHPRRPVKSVVRTHVFTHVEWKMRCYEFECCAAPDRFVWASEERLAGEIPLPTAFRLFLEE